MNFYKKNIIILFWFSICIGSDDISTKEIDYSYKKDQLIAFGLSGLFSGAGQFYLGDWKKGLIYSSVELLEWAYRYEYIDKNKLDVNIYKDYAIEEWSFKKWIQDYYSFNNSGSSVYDAFLNDSDEYSDPWLGAHGVWFEYCENGNLDICENGIYVSTADPNNMPAVYSNICGDAEKNGCDIDLEAIESYVGDILVDHHLYEGIGKYNVYFSGWEDAVDSTSWIVDRGNNYKIATSYKKEYYESTLRRKAKESSDMAENALTAIFINHAVSMLDALINKNNKNNNMKFSTYFSSDNKFGIGGINFQMNIK